MSIIWIHEDAITLDHPVVAAAGEGAQAVFIWDTQCHDARKWSLKRRVFVYECALDLDIPIYAGDPYAVLQALAGDAPIYAADTPDPYIRDILSDLRDTHDVQTVAAPGLAQIPANTDTKRFFRFWNRAKKSALTHSKNLQLQDMPAS